MILQLDLGMWTYLSVIWTEQVGTERGCANRLGLELEMAWVEWKSSRLRELGWGTGYDTACASWSMPWLWGRSAWVERLDVVWESPVVWGIVKEDSALRLEFLFDVGKEVSTGLDWCSACGTQSRSDGLLKSSGWGGQENLPG